MPTLTTPTTTTQVPLGRCEKCWREAMRRAKKPQDAVAEYLTIAASASAPCQR